MHKQMPMQQTDNNLGVPQTCVNVSIRGGRDLMRVKFGTANVDSLKYLLPPLSNYEIFASVSLGLRLSCGTSVDAI